MPRIYLTQLADIPAQPRDVYEVLADYREGHPAILPSGYFSELRVEEGGYGAGTRIAFEMTLFGQTHSVWGIVTEPEPGRVLVETYPDSATVTTFTVDDGPRNGSRVTIETEWFAKGLSGFFQWLLLPRLFRKIYAEELRNLAQYLNRDA